jgi:hypothetical protein
MNREEALYADFSYRDKMSNVKTSCPDTPLRFLIRGTKSDQRRIPTIIIARTRKWTDLVSPFTNLISR